MEFKDSIDGLYKEMMVRWVVSLTELGLTVVGSKKV